MTAESMVFSEDLIGKELGLLVYSTYFECPYCGHSRDRGGSKEGFVKSGMNNHVSHCYDLRLAEKGYVRALWVNGKLSVKTFEQIKQSGPRGPIVVRSIKAALAKARREKRL